MAALHCCRAKGDSNNNWQRINMGIITKLLWSDLLQDAIVAVA